MAHPIRDWKYYLRALPDAARRELGHGHACVNLFMTNHGNTCYPNDSFWPDCRPAGKPSSCTRNHGLLAEIPACARALTLPAARSLRQPTGLTGERPRRPGRQPNVRFQRCESLPNIRGGRASPMSPTCSEHACASRPYSNVALEEGSELIRSRRQLSATATDNVKVEAHYRIDQLAHHHLSVAAHWHPE